ncbi:MAG: phosphatase PAP2 family protein [Candidatus Eremiobacteraeota bacterium]|nr:phosphatase PAP2 family protein [Candidatus Eremiobacteraeota bacterium]MBC5828070.1 phosphatase PAP2 family protein [Candidatus Eremiobacteraeota bacterium]
MDWNRSGFDVTMPLIDIVAILSAKYAVAVPIAVVVIAWLRNRAHFSPTAFVIGGALAAIVTYVVGRAGYDARPFVVLKVAPLVTHPADNGFPSDHLVLAAYASTYAAFFDRRLAAIAFFASAALAAARVFCLLHWPIDIAAGTLIGALCAVAMDPFRRTIAAKRIRARD